MPSHGSGHPMKGKYPDDHSLFLAKARPEQGLRSRSAARALVSSEKAIEVMNFQGLNFEVWTEPPLL